MNGRILLTVLFLAVAALAGCDDQATTRPDDELIVGTWRGDAMNARTVVGISVPVLDFQAGDVVRFVFEEDGGYTFRFEPADGRELTIPGTDVSVPLDQDASFSGNYTLDEGDGTIFLSASDDLPVGLTLEYDFDGDDALEVIAEDAETLGALVGLTDLEELELLATVVTGGSISYRRN